jgi:hypothetical protein
MKSDSCLRTEQQTGQWFWFIRANESGQSAPLFGSFISTLLAFPALYQLTMDKCIRARKKNAIE